MNGVVAGRRGARLAAITSGGAIPELADYRVNTGLPLSAANVNASTTLQADTDRRALAKDVFARLIVALGAAGQVTLTPGGGYTLTLPDPVAYALAGQTFTVQNYNALRYLAQLAANIVDHIDSDDVSTVFVWNPDPTNPAGVDWNSTTDVGNRVVFGVEKPRLVINEAYSEIVNDPADAADTTQEVFLKVFRGIKRFNGESSLKTWLYRIAVHEASNQRRWWFRHKSKETSMESREDANGNAFGLFDAWAIDDRGLDILGGDRYDYQGVER